MRTAEPAFLTAATIALLLAGQPSWGQPGAENPWERIVGNWRMSYEDESGQHHGYMIIKYGTRPALEAFIERPDGIESLWSWFPPYADLEFDGVVLRTRRMEVDYEMRLSSDGNTLEGTWTHRQHSGRQGTGGREVWRREIPVIESLSIRPEFKAGYGEQFGDGDVGYLEVERWSYPDLESKWKYASGMPANFPAIHITVRGARLPIWHRGAVKELSFSDPKLHLGTTPSVGPDGEMAFSVRLSPGTLPGRKVLFFNGAEVPFDLVFDDYTADYEVAWVRITTPEPPYRQLEDLDIGRQVRVLVGVESETEETSVPVQVRTTEAGDRITVLAHLIGPRQGPWLLFATDPLRIIPTDPSGGEPESEGTSSE